MHVMLCRVVLCYGMLCFVHYPASCIYLAKTIHIYVRIFHFSHVPPLMEAEKMNTLIKSVHNGGIIILLCYMYLYDDNLADHDPC